MPNPMATAAHGGPTSDHTTKLRAHNQVRSAAMSWMRSSTSPRDWPNGFVARVSASNQTSRIAAKATGPFRENAQFVRWFGRKIQKPITTAALLAIVSRSVHGRVAIRTYSDLTAAPKPAGTPSTPIAHLRMETTADTGPTVAPAAREGN